MKNEKLDEIVLRKLSVGAIPELHLEKWQEFLHRFHNPSKKVTVGLIGKYVELKESYKSIAEALIHAGAQNDCRVKVEWIHSESLTEDNITDKLKGLKGILVAPGFGNRGIEGKVTAINYAREHKIPFLGICLGMQCAVIEFARNVVGLAGAHSTEFNKDTPHGVICLMDKQRNVVDMGGTMRLGKQAANLARGSLAHECYEADTIDERHRHRYEFNNVYRQQFAAHGMTFSGTSPDGKLVEIVELPDHPWFLAVQFHPEFQSQPTKAHPLFAGFIEAAIARYDERGQRIGEQEAHHVV
jgi:CTP synthase